VGDTLTGCSLVAAAMTEPAITLYRLQACPFCERVVRKLDDLGLDYHSRFVEARHSRRDVVKRLTGARTVPAIVDEQTGVTMSESANIVEYLDATYGDGDGEPPEWVSADAAGDAVRELEGDGGDEEDAEEVEAE
jgi:glutathione S-transferase